MIEATHSKVPSAPLLELKGIEKSFGPVCVLKALDLQLKSGEILGLIGENGAGKSTLLNLLGGVRTPSSGTMWLRGKPYLPTGPRDAEKAGFAFIHQELNLFPNLTVSENLFLTRFPQRHAAVPWINQSDLRQRTRQLLQKVGLDLSPDTPVSRLSTGQQQLVEVARAISFSASIVLFDEPTTSLAEREKLHLFSLIRQLKQEGIAIVFISHTLEEVCELCDHVLLLRDGEITGHMQKGSFDIARMIQLMVGRPLSQAFPEKTNKPLAEPLLTVHDLSSENRIHNISFELHKSEILGISGLMGSGRTELLRALFGLDASKSGDIRLGNTPIASMSLRDRIRQGLAFVTEDRRMEGLCINGSVRANTLLASFERVASKWFKWISQSDANDTVNVTRERVNLDRSVKDTQPARELSGGNQQKIVIGKWLIRKPRVFLLDEPTRGIDVGAKFEIYSLIHELVRNGSGVIVVSSEIEELMGLCDRILVMHRGTIVSAFDREGFDRECMLNAAFTGEGAVS